MLKKLLQLPNELLCLFFPGVKPPFNYKPSRYTGQISNPEIAERIIRGKWDKDRINKQEEVCALFVDAEGYYISFDHICTGSRRKCFVDVRTLIHKALDRGASGIFLAHNHPSGIRKASQSDKDITKVIMDICPVIDLELLDHIILTPKGYFSFLDEGILG